MEWWSVVQRAAHWTSAYPVLHSENFTSSTCISQKKLDLPLRNALSDLKLVDRMRQAANAQTIERGWSWSSSIDLVGLHHKSSFGCCWTVADNSGVVGMEPKIKIEKEQSYRSASIVSVGAWKGPMFVTQFFFSRCARKLRRDKRLVNVDAYVPIMDADISCCGSA